MSYFCLLLLCTLLLLLLCLLTHVVEDFLGAVGGLDVDFLLQGDAEGVEDLEMGDEGNADAGASERGDDGIEKHEWHVVEQGANIIDGPHGVVVQEMFVDTQGALGGDELGSEYAGGGKEIVDGGVDAAGDTVAVPRDQGDGFGHVSFVVCSLCCIEGCNLNMTSRPGEKNTKLVTQKHNTHSSHLRAG